MKQDLTNEEIFEARRKIGDLKTQLYKTCQDVLDLTLGLKKSKFTEAVSERYDALALEKRLSMGFKEFRMKLEERNETLKDMAFIDSVDEAKAAVNAISGDVNEFVDRYNDCIVALDPEDEHGLKIIGTEPVRKAKTDLLSWKHLHKEMEEMIREMPT